MIFHHIEPQLAQRLSITKGVVPTAVVIDDAEIRRDPYQNTGSPVVSLEVR